MLNHEFPRADDLFSIHFGFARMEIVVSRITPLGTIRAHPRDEELLVPASLSLNWLSHVFTDLHADMYLSGDAFP